jgi:Tol biopolymer transport system component/DNA-binding winged helix-turn-helix (wHTH) protein
MPADVYEFGDVEVRIRRMEVRRAGDVVALEPKAFDVLRHLLENRDRVVSKDELLDAVWSGTFVTPNALTRAIAQLRKALGDDAFEARYIRTVARRGYRFIAPARVGGEAGPGEPTLLRPRRLTAARDSYGWPAISPDGSTIAYGSTRSGTEEIWVAGLAPGSRELPITADGGGNVQPAYSPDGQWLAFHSRKRRGVWVVPSTGGVPRQVAAFGSQPAWSPDSRTIVFTSGPGGLTSQAVLWTVGRDGGCPVPLTTLGSPPGGHLEPAWSHDGRLVAFMVGRHEQREIFVLGVNGGAPRRLATLARASGPRFSPDDRALYWVDKTAERNDCLVRLKLDREGNPAGDPETILAFHGEGVGTPSIAQDATAAFSWARLSANLFAVDVDASGAGGVPRQLTFDDGIIRYPSYAPDGRIAYEQEVAGRSVTAWVIDEEGRSREPLSAGLSVSVRAPQWDSDAKRVLAFVQPGSDGPEHFGWIDVATRQLTRIPAEASGAVSQPSLSPDGEALAFHLVDADGSVNAWVQRLDGGARRQVTFDREAASYPRWSQDGRWLAVNLKRGEDAHVGVVSAEGGPVEQLTFGHGIRWPYTFSPDGDRIAFAGGLQGESVWNIYSVSRRTREVTQLTRFSSGGARFPAWSPRGNRIVFTGAERTGGLWTVKLPS